MVDGLLPVKRAAEAVDKRPWPTREVHGNEPQGDVETVIAAQASGRSADAATSALLERVDKIAWAWRERPSSLSSRRWRPRAHARDGRRGPGPRIDSIGPCHIVLEVEDNPSNLLLVERILAGRRDLDLITHLPRDGERPTLRAGTGRGSCHWTSTCPTAMAMRCWSGDGRTRRLRRDPWW